MIASNLASHGLASLCRRIWILTRTQIRVITIIFTLIITVFSSSLSCITKYHTATVALTLQSPSSKSKISQNSFACKRHNRFPENGYSSESAESSKLWYYGKRRYLSLIKIRRRLTRPITSWMLVRRRHLLAAEVSFTWARIFYRRRFFRLLYKSHENSPGVPSCTAEEEEYEENVEKEEGKHDEDEEEEGEKRKARKKILKRKKIWEEEKEKKSRKWKWGRETMMTVKKWSKKKMMNMI